MAIKFSLVPNPTFTAKVTLHTPGGADEKVEFTFRHMSEPDRIALDDEGAARADELRVQMGVPEDIETAIKDGTFDIKAHKQYLRALRAERLPRLLKVLAGWELSDRFNEENLGLLLANYPSAFDSIMDTYRTELDGARAKN